MRDHEDETAFSGTENFAKSLGWFSIALGAAEIFAPRVLSRLIGIKEQPILLPALGLREITSGVGILTQREPTGWVWSRVAGDAVDLGLLATAYMSDACEDEDRIEAAAAAVAGVTLADIACAVLLSRGERRRSRQISQTITIGRTPEELYGFWRTLENLPRVMRYLESVRSIGDNRSHWVARGPGGVDVEWDAEIVEDRPNEFIAWRSLPGADVDNSGYVRFQRAAGGRGTIVRVAMEYTPPAGGVGAMVSKLFGRAPEQEIQIDLYRLKQIMETGQVTTTEGQPAGRPTSTSPAYDHGTTRG
ncbi:MAG: SRPBCC family protein [Chthoniobacterales bacterium]